MHKDKPPGLFDFAERSVRYLVGFWFAAGLVLSLIVHTGILITRADAKGSGAKETPETLEAKAISHRPAGAPTQPPTSAVRY
jgi:hypothetical protein